MVRAQFEEKEYEIAFSVEMGNSTQPTPIFSSGVVAEKVLGYDAAADPKHLHTIWRLLNIERPAGVTLFPHFWRMGQEPPLDRLPGVPISIILQYKRPEYLRGGKAKQWSRWHSPYFRFSRSMEQHSILRRIESKLGQEVVVRYAAPAFHTRGEYENAVLQRKILEQTGFVSPTLLGNHKVWTYNQPGNAGFGNPSGRWQRFDAVENLFQDLLSSASDPLLRGITSAVAIPQNFDSHLSNLVAATTFRRPQIRALISGWEQSILAGDLNLDRLLIQRVLQIATVQSTLRKLGASWHMSNG